MPPRRFQQADAIDRNDPNTWAQAYGAQRNTKVKWNAEKKRFVGKYKRKAHTRTYKTTGKWRELKHIPLPSKTYRKKNTRGFMMLRRWINNSRMPYDKARFYYPKK